MFGPVCPESPRHSGHTLFLGVMETPGRDKLFLWAETERKRGPSHAGDVDLLKQLLEVRDVFSPRAKVAIGSSGTNSEAHIGVCDSPS